ncbi:hypothetical protein [Mesorhizobium sp. Root157]|uniref:hypothetical protein n=1 Tax=Mesorhizobium sp. Root157 TaxID=1736477 RepID=UPI000B1C039D|nr:hypothetical protein [Mesorhizobium sp. Root157]
MPLNLLQQLFEPPAQQMTQPRQVQTTTGQQPSFFQQLLSPDVALPVAGALLGNRGNAGNFGAAFGEMGPALKNNKTFRYLQEHDPNLRARCKTACWTQRTLMASCFRSERRRSQNIATTPLMAIWFAPMKTAAEAALFIAVRAHAQ